MKRIVRMSANWASMSAADLGRQIRVGSINPVELTEFFLERISTSDAGDQIFCLNTAQRAREEALTCRERQLSERLLSPLDGVPVSWKDLYDTKGDLTLSGTPLLAGRVAKADARVVTNAIAAGMILIGKTHQTEFAFSGLGINPNTATPPNKRFEGCAPGGSSSGAGASVAFGLAPIAIGSDTGGSVRIPACWNDLVGLKTTHGLLSTKGVIPLCSGFDTVGPLAQTVEDADLMFNVLSEDASSSIDVPDFSVLKLAVADGPAFSDCEAEVITEIEAVIKRLGDAGASIERVNSPLIQDALDIAGPVFTYEAWNEWGALINATSNKMYKPVEDRFRGGENVTKEKYLATWEKLKKIRDQFWSEMAEFDGILMPTTPMKPPLVAPLLADESLFNKTNLLALRNTRIVNLMGGCALTLPTQEFGIGLQCAAKPKDDARLLKIGHALEKLVRT